MTLPILVIPLVLAVAAMAVWALTRAFRDRIRMRRTLEEQGYRIHHMGLRWATRGPFPGPPAGLKGAGWLYRIVVEDRDRRTYVAWIRCQVPWPWQNERQELRWDDRPDAKPRGLSTALFIGPILLCGPLPAVLWLMGVGNEALFISPLLAGATVATFLIVAWRDANR